MRSSTAIRSSRPADLPVELLVLGNQQLPLARLAQPALAGQQLALLGLDRIAVPRALIQVVAIQAIGPPAMATIGISMPHSM